MDPALLREREAFRRRALAIPTVEKRKAKPDESHKSSKKPRPTPKPKRTYKLIICYGKLSDNVMVPTLTENLKKWAGIFQSGKIREFLSRLEKSGNFTQNT